MHLYYARFISHFLHSEGLVPTKEPFTQLLLQGMVMGKSYRLKSGKYLRADEVKEIDKSNFIEISSGKQVFCEWEKMSKSKCNGVDPMELFSEYGIDTTRLLMLADVAPTSHREWCLSSKNTSFRIIILRKNANILLKVNNFVILLICSIRWYSQLATSSVAHCPKVSSIETVTNDGGAVGQTDK